MNLLLEPDQELHVGDVIPTQDLLAPAGVAWWLIESVNDDGTFVAVHVEHTPKGTG